MLIAGRRELAHELQPLSLDVRAFIADSARMLLLAPWFDDLLEGTFPDAQRLPNVRVRVRERIAELAREPGPRRGRSESEHAPARE